MICPNCGKDAGENKFCPECGTNLGNSDNLAENKHGEDVTTQNNNSQDPAYYEALKKIEEEKKQEEAAQKKKKNKKKAIGCSIIFIIVIALIAGIILIPKFAAKIKGTSENIESNKDSYVDLSAESVSLSRTNIQSKSKAERDIHIDDFILKLKNTSDKDIEKVDMTFSIYNSEGVNKGDAIYKFEIVIPAGETVTLTPEQWEYSALYLVAVAKKQTYGYSFADVFVGPSFNELEAVADYKTLSISNVHIKFSDETTVDQEGQHQFENIYYTGVYEDTFYYLEYPEKGAVEQKSMPFDDFMKLPSDDKILTDYNVLLPKS